MKQTTQTMPTVNETMTTKEVADVLGVTVARVGQMIKEEKLQATRKGGRWLVWRDSVYQLQAKRL